VPFDLIDAGTSLATAELALDVVEDVDVPVLVLVLVLDELLEPHAAIRTTPKTAAGAPNQRFHEFISHSFAQKNGRQHMRPQDL
jgi:hypothetical protein